MAHPIAVVTGASQGIGLATVHALLAADYEVYAQYRTQPAELEHPHLHWWQADFAQPQQLAATLPDALRTAPTIAAVVHCAGVAILGPCAGTEAAVWQQHMDVNAVAPAVLTTALLPQLRAAEGAVIVVNSGAGQHTHPQWGAYSASKHAARAWANALRAEEPQLRVTSIYPGRVATGMQAAIHEFEGRAYDPAVYIQPETVAGTIMHTLQLPADAVVSDLSIRPR